MKIANLQVHVTANPTRAEEAGREAGRRLVEGMTSGLDHDAIRRATRAHRASTQGVSGTMTFDTTTNVTATDEQDEQDEPQVLTRDDLDPYSEEHEEFARWFGTYEYEITESMAVAYDRSDDNDIEAGTFELVAEDWDETLSPGIDEVYGHCDQSFDTYDFYSDGYDDERDDYGNITRREWTSSRTSESPMSSFEVEFDARIVLTGRVERKFLHDAEDIWLAHQCECPLCEAEKPLRAVKDGAEAIVSKLRWATKEEVRAFGNGYTSGPFTITGGGIVTLTVPSLDGMSLRLASVRPLPGSDSLVVERVNYDSVTTVYIGHHEVDPATTKLEDGTVPTIADAIRAFADALEAAFMSVGGDHEGTVTSDPVTTDYVPRGTVFYKVTSANGHAIHGGDFQYSLPVNERPEGSYADQWTAGDWTPDEQPSMCNSGYHTTLHPPTWINGIDNRVLVAETKGSLPTLNDDKRCSRSIRAVREIDYDRMMPNFARARTFYTEVISPALDRYEEIVGNPDGGLGDLPDFAVVSNGEADLWGNPVYTRRYGDLPYETDRAVDGTIDVSASRAVKLLTDTVRQRSYGIGTESRVLDLIAHDTAMAVMTSATAQPEVEAIWEIVASGHLPTSQEKPFGPMRCVVSPVIAERLAAAALDAS